MHNKQVKEAIKRLNLLKIDSRVVESFVEDHVVLMSDIGDEIICELDEHEKELILKWEKNTGNVVYHVIKDFSLKGLFYCIFYVSQYEEEWDMDIRYLEQQNPIIYVMNMITEEYSEYGSILFKEKDGVLLRTA